MGADTMSLSRMNGSIVELVCALLVVRRFNTGDRVVMRWTGHGCHVAELNGIPHRGSPSIRRHLHPQAQRRQEHGDQGLLFPVASSSASRVNASFQDGRPSEPWIDHRTNFVAPISGARSVMSSR